MQAIESHRQDDADGKKDEVGDAPEGASALEGEFAEREEEDVELVQVVGLVREKDAVPRIAAEVGLPGIDVVGEKIGSAPLEVDPAMEGLA